MFIGYGKIQVKNGIRVIVGLDLILYYRSLYNFATYKTVRSQLPAHGGHISIILPDIHKGVDFNKAKSYNGQDVSFIYDPKDVTITRKNIWMKVDLPIGWEIKRLVGAVDKNFLGYHLTIANFKF